ncbi:hypothetical protein BV898_11270 [Hypsibius exemplaris]|uniref:rRNA biogenesis protein RRP36 n=1 Tax=Hypsibius exemplaris TaxID=2072580 RepID=A0A1W0WH82_HYPEX|nr:hypothetical protein BV898_11270 [Hypsibius exemplaris]
MDEPGTSEWRESPLPPRETAEKNLSLRQRKNAKNAPLEISSKKPPALPAPSLAGIKKQRYRDPRFDEKCGSLGTVSFEKNYQFVFELREKELQTVRQQHRRERDPERKAQLKDLLTRLENQERARTQKKKAEEKDSERKVAQTQLVASGKNPYFLKKSDKSILDMVSQFQELKKTGKLKKYMEKKRKRNAKSDSKGLPKSS